MKHAKFHQPNLGIPARIIDVYLRPIRSRMFLGEQTIVRPLPEDAATFNNDIELLGYTSELGGVVTGDNPFGLIFQIAVGRDLYGYVFSVIRPRQGQYPSHAPIWDSQRMARDGAALRKLIAELRQESQREVDAWRHAWANADRYDAAAEVGMATTRQGIIDDAKVTTKAIETLRHALPIGNGHFHDGQIGGPGQQVNFIGN